MTPQDTLTAQASALLNDLNHQLERLGVYAGQSGDLVIAQLRKNLNAQVRRLEDLICVGFRGADLTDARGNYREINVECRNLFGECLAVSIAPAIRNLALDDGACLIVERLLRRLGDLVGVSWGHLTMLADSEFFATASQVIRIRYPASTILDFPIAAHEFGHFVGPRWPAPGKEISGYTNFMGVQDLGPPAHLEEYFADLFATLILGPAYVNTCLLHRFDPTEDGDKTHPGDRHRAVWILTGLELLAERSEGQNAIRLKQLLASRLREWNDTVEASGTAPLDERSRTALRVRARDLWKAMMKWSGDAAFTDILPALRIRADFHAGRHTVTNPSIRNDGSKDADALLPLDDSAAKLVPGMHPGNFLSVRFLSRDFEDVTEGIIVKFTHRGEVGGESFAVACLQLLDEKLYVGCNDLVGRLGF